MKERWLPVVGFEGCYEVSDLGHVRSVDRVLLFPSYVTRSGDTRSASVRSFKGQLLRPGPAKSGHLTVAIGRGNSRLVHQLVLEAFVGPCPVGQEVLHRDHDPSNNKLKNLKYGTRSENLKMDFVAGTRRVHPNFIGARWRAGA